MSPSTDVAPSGSAAASPVAGGARPVDLVIHASRAIIDGQEQSASLLVRMGRIVGIEPYGSAAPSRLVATLEPDEVLIPGLVDTHVHINEPGRTEWEGFDSATRAAAAAGVTTLIDMPLNSLPPTLTAKALAAKKVAARGRCRVDVGFWGGSVPTNLDDLPELFAAGVFGVKCFLQDSGVPEFPPLTTGEMRSAMRVIAGVGGLMLVHAEDPGVLHTAPVPRGPSYQAFVESRPAEAETGAIAACIEAAAITRCRTHIVHLSSAGGVALIRRAKANGVPITAETCPHYLTLAAETIPDGCAAVQVLPADPRPGRPGRAVGRPGRRHHRHRGQRSLAEHPGAQAARGRRPRPGLGRNRLGAVRFRRGVAGGESAGHPADHRPRVDVPRAGRPGRPGTQGPDRDRRRRRPRRAGR